MIVIVEHGEVARVLRFKEPGFGRGVGFEGVVTVQVIRRHVQTSTNGGAEVVNGFELKTR